MKRFLAVIICFAMMLSAASCSKRESLPTKRPIRIAINQWPGFAHAFIAQEKGFFAKNNVQVDLVFKKEASDSFKLYQNAEVDGCFTVLPDALLLNLMGIPTKAVCVVDYSVDGDVIIGRPGIESLSELEGKTVSFEGANSFSRIFVLTMLGKAGLKESDLRFADLPAQDVWRSIEKGLIDAGHTWEPTKSEALKNGCKVLARAGDVPGIIVSVLVFDDDVIIKRPDDVRAVVRSLFEALDFAKRNPEEALKIMAQGEGMSEDEMRRGLEGIYQPDIKENLELTTTTTTTTIPPLIASFNIASNFYLTHGQMAKELKLREVFDTRFLKEIAK
jgi:NitT/TauT family transport system substrate-binding protein